MTYLDPHLQLLLVAGAAAVINGAVTGHVGRAAVRLGAVARRDARRRHERDTPLLGGTGFWLLLTALVALAASPWGPALGLPAVPWVQAAGLMASFTLIYAVGALDDARELKAPPKLLGQLAATAIVLLTSPSSPELLGWAGPQWVQTLLLVAWVIGVTNAINLIDGLDGLATGITAFSAATLSLILIFDGTAGPSLGAFLTAALAGGCVGFLFHNFHPARIFLGDSGSLLLGFVLAVVSIQVDVKRSLFVSLSIPLMVLALPILDVVLSVIRRRRLDRPVLKGDRSHIHHRLQQVGLSHRSAVLFLWTCTAYLNVSAYFLAQLPPQLSIYVYAMSVPTIGFWLMALWFVERRLGYQAARFSQLFLKQEDAELRDAGRLSIYARRQMDEHAKSGTPFIVIELDSHHFMRELAHERPARMVAFYMSLYGVLKGRVRASDLVARVGEHRFVVVLAGAPGPAAAGESDPPVVAYLNDQVKALQESYGVFQSHPKRAEGIRVLYYPKDAQAIRQALEQGSATEARGRSAA